jgi:3-phosphoshikimate 1-carboxyvinyltransferase
MKKEYGNASLSLQSAPMSASSKDRGLDPGRRIRGTLRPPGSKSLAIRSLLAAGLTPGRTVLEGVSRGDDVRAALRVLRTCGVEIAELGEGRVSVDGLDPLAWGSTAPVDCGESGTLARLMLAVLGFCPRPGTASVVTARGTLLSRFSTPLLSTLRAGGVGVSEHSSRGSWPVTLESAPPGPELRLDSPSSSQELSGLLLALAGAGQGGAVKLVGDLPSRPYVRMTIDVLGDFGVTVSGESLSDGECFTVEGTLRIPTTSVAIEPDASAAAVALAAGCLSGGEVEVPGFGEESRQGDVAIVRYLREFGCVAEYRGGTLRSGGFPTRGASLDLAGEPDLAPVLAAVAGAVAPAVSRLSGLETLNAKESRRVDVLAEGLRLAGIAVEVGGDGAWMEIGGEARKGADRILLDPHGDHRMAFAFALLGLVRSGVRVSSPECVAKSWPDFWEALG